MCSIAYHKVIEMLLSRLLLATSQQGCGKIGKSKGPSRGQGDGRPLAGRGVSPPHLLFFLPPKAAKGTLQQP